MINAANPAIVRTWDEVHKKFNNLATQAKLLYAQYKGDLVATGGGCLPGEVPSGAAFIVKRILSPVVLEGLDGRFESGVTATIPKAIVEAIDYSQIDDREMDMNVWGIVPAEVLVLTPIDTPDPAPTTVDALAMEKAKFAAEVEKLRAETEILQLQKELLKHDLLERQHQSDQWNI
uniref:Uncharacterized protein n=1 Tax=Plectus sambesii TaxID=2011161 RepID=A0A914UX53_9BILA